PETLFAELHRQLNDEQMVELTATIAWENYRARFDHALGIEAQGFSDGAYCVRPEPPKGSGGRLRRAASTLWRGRVVATHAGTAVVLRAVAGGFGLVTC